MSDPSVRSGPPRAPMSAWRMDAVAPLSPNGWLRHDAVMHLFPSSGATDVLEIGCGQGGFGARLAQRHRYLGIEPDHASFTVAEQRLRHAGGGEVRNARLELLESGQFDVVCAFEVLEHLDDDTAALAAWVERVRPGGLLLLSVPAYQRRYAAADELVGHFRRYDPGPLHNLLTAAGLVDVRIRHYGMPLGYVLEGGRNVIARRRLRAAGSTSPQQRSAGSGRLLQPSSGLRGALNRCGSAPFRLLQRAFPKTGPGLVAAARRPAGP
ncbi:class I SAM-dependent methyltransferase [Dactylosporangium sp. NPDC006015]|uniref:class I SAM-dependent methyltransferase n=1 Tax=Dactylosporangium sp. NPDC006015 TaxID=3154576 RepID=UPI0033BE925D